MHCSLQCGRQIAELKAEYEESKKRVEEAAKLRQVGYEWLAYSQFKLQLGSTNTVFYIKQKTSSLQSLLENRKVDTGGRQVEADLDQSIKRKEDTAELHTVAARRNDGPPLKGSEKSFN